MSPVALGTMASVLLVWTVLVLIPMVPGGMIDTRDFAGLPRWQFNAFNVFLTSLGLASLVTAWFTLDGGHPALAVALVIGLLYIGVFGFDLAGIFPKVADRLPVQLLVLEVLDLAAAGALVVVTVQGLRR
jgi:hypothetical protein